MTKTVAQFKAAFQLGAATKNKKIRWTAPQKFWQSQTSLKDIKTALDDLDGCADDERRAKLAEVRKAIAALEPKKRTKYEDALKDLGAELDKMVVESSETLAGPPRISKFETGGGTFGFSDENGKVIAENLKRERVEFAHNVMGRLKKLGSDNGVAIDDLSGLLETILKDTKMGASSSNVDGTVWAEAMKHVNDTVLPGIARDLDTMKASGLVGDGAALKGVRFTGSDFHKGGKQVLILRFEDGGQQKKVVYKPSSLKVDSLLFGKDGVGAKLGGISTYNIVPAESDDDPPQDLGFGYMEFVDTQGGPTGSADVMGIYKSIAGAMAMSYYVGLEDVHHENVLMKKGAVQVIDMEATTGTFPMPTKNADKGGGFIDQQWGKAINDGFKQKLLTLIDEGKLGSLPKLEVIEGTMVTEFRQVATNWAKSTMATDLKRLEDELAKQRTRLVPIATEGLQGLIPIAQQATYRVKDKDKAGNLASWIEFVDAKLVQAEKDQDEGESTTFIGNLIGSTTTPAKTVRNLIVSPGAYNALRRGDVPYYIRELGSSKVFDEENNPIAVPGLKKVGRGIAQDMAERRTSSPDQAVSLFKLQGVALVKKMHTELKQRLDSKG
jgi:hypothetical protein